MNRDTMLRWLNGDPPDDGDYVDFAIFDQIRAAKHELLDTENIPNTDPERWPTRRSLISRLHLFEQLHIWAFTLSDDHCDHLAQLPIQPTYYVPDERAAMCGPCWRELGVDLLDNHRGNDDLCNGCYRRKKPEFMKYVILHAHYNVASFRLCPDCHEAMTETTHIDDYGTSPEWW
jgi:hypothetical protein